MKHLQERLIFKGQLLTDLLKGIRQMKPEDANPDFTQRTYGWTPELGLWCVGDQGVYLMSNAIPEGEIPSVICYAEGINPDEDDDWYDKKVSLFGGDDGVEFIPLSQIPLETNRIEIELTEDSVTVYAMVSPETVPHG